MQVLTSLHAPREGESDIHCSLVGNGEVFGGELRAPREGESDTAIITETVCSVLSRGDSAHRALTDLFYNVLGPFAVCISTNGMLYFARDPGGRRSLLIELPKTCSEPFVVSSIATTGTSNASELAPRGVYCLALRPSSMACTLPGLLQWSMPSCKAGLVWELSCMPWPHESPHRTGLDTLPCIPPHSDIERLGEPWVTDVEVAAYALEFLRRLGEAVRVRVQTGVPAHSAATMCSSCCAPAPRACLEVNVSDALSRDGEARSISLLPAIASSCSPCGDCHKRAARVAIPFSGGLDSMVLARLAHEFIEEGEVIDLINVCFAVGHRSPDRLAAIAGLQVRQSRFPCNVPRALQW